MIEKIHDSFIIEAACPKIHLKASQGLQNTKPLKWTEPTDHASFFNAYETSENPILVVPLLMTN